MKIVGFLFLVFILVACANDEGEPDVNTVSVPFSMKKTNIDSHSECDGSPSGEPVVYVFENFDGIVDDVDEIEPNPINIESSYDIDEIEYTFNLSFVEAGSYRLSVTCESTLDDEVEDNDIIFLSRKGVYLRVGDLSVVSDNDPLPPSHLNVKPTCTGCHYGTQEYDLAFVDHAFVEGFCADCHN